ncbi:unnamed protein product [Mytilus edulis]|uniref:Endonuclease/exonuclease/phosphatase domain-containing protein n=1 Tax=Mytilus edulis TaxID=6550 RepID=A0A8S3UYK7_MYTED|nr:unnamed protein product [Mytilus edulis]
MPRQDRGPCSILAKFERRKDRNRVLEAAKNKLKQKPQYYVHEKFPVEIIERRRELIPILKDAHVLFGAVYIPPENSKYANTDAFEEIEIELLTFADKFDSYVSLIGDFNAKTGTRDDFIVPDESLIGIFELESDDEILSYMLDYEQLKLQNIPLSRMSECHCNINNYGHKLLDMCKKTNVYIANSRLGSDIGIGRTTCKDISVIDYLLLSSKLFSLVDEFEILDFVPLFLMFTMQYSLFLNQYYHMMKLHMIHHKTIKWNDNNRNEFVNTFHNSQDQLTNIMNDLENIHTRDTCTQQDIDNITGEINELFQNTAKATLSKPHYKSRKKPNSKPWYTNKCLTSRKKIHKARKRYNIHKNEVTRKQLLETSKSYKMVTNQAYKNYQFDFEQKLRNTSKKQGKEFWKILNKFVKNKDEKSEISVETLHDYFKSMNENNVHDEIDIDIDVNNLPPDIEELLNSPITVEEIKYPDLYVGQNISLPMTHHH